MIRRIWVYKARVYSRDGQYYVGYEQAVTDAEYGQPAYRAFVEDCVHARVRHVEGVTPDMPIEAAWEEVRLPEVSRAADDLHQG